MTHNQNSEILNSIYDLAQRIYKISLTEYDNNSVYFKFEGKNISKLSNEEMRPFRGQSMAMIFQEI